MLRIAVVLLLAVQVLAAQSVEARGGAKVAAAGGMAGRPIKTFSLEGGGAGVDGDFEFDLDISSKRKLQQMHEQFDDEEEEEDILLGGKPKAPRDLSSKIVASGMNYGRGTRYVTTTIVAPGEALFSVPFMEIMSMNTARQGRVKALLDANPTLPSSVALALHLLEEQFKGPSSRFFEYIQSMPTTHAMNSTMFYQDHDMELLRGSHLLRLTQGRIQGMGNFYDALVGPVTSLALDPPLFAKEEFTKQNFEWAMGTVWARAFSLTDDENDVVIAPILDTIGLCGEDACHKKNQLVWDTQAQRVIVYANHEYSAGEEVLLDLQADKASTLLMLNHGFARSEPPSSKEVETMDISIFLDPNDALLSVKSHLLESHNLSMNGSYVLRDKSEQLDSQLVKSLKLKLLVAAELDKYHTLFASTEQEDDGSYPIVSLRNEYVFTRALVFSCKNLLAEYPTTLDQDRAQRDELEKRYRTRRSGGAASTDRKLQILRALVIEKEILHHTMQLVLKQWEELLFQADPSAFV